MIKSIGDCRSPVLAIGQFLCQVAGPVDEDYLHCIFIRYYNEPRKKRNTFITTSRTEYFVFLFLLNTKQELLMLLELGTYHCLRRNPRESLLRSVVIWRLENASVPHIRQSTSFVGAAG